MTHHPERLARLAFCNIWEVTPEPRRRPSVWRHRIEGAVWGIVSAGALAFFIVGSLLP